MSNLELNWPKTESKIPKRDSFQLGEKAHESKLIMFMCGAIHTNAIGVHVVNVANQKNV